MPGPSRNHTDSLEPDRVRVLTQVAERIGYEFEDLELLDRALTHASLVNSGRQSYERLEFLGDAILGFLVAEVLFRESPDIPQGELTDRRAERVSRPPLSDIARELELPQALAVGRGLRSSELDSRRIQADLVEAVLGALYLDGGIEPARAFVRRFVLEPTPKLGIRPRATRDPKSRLLHLAQSEGLGQPTYELLDMTGPDHEREFTVAVSISDTRYGSGTARSKQLAEKEAAEQAWEALRSDLDDVSHAEAE